MISSVVLSLFLGALVAVVAPVGAQCDPSNAVVAVASVLSTLAVVTIILTGVYFFLRRRRQGIKLSKNVYTVKKRGNEHNNYGFTDNEKLSHLEGVTTPRMEGRAHFPKQVSPGGNSSDIWQSPSRSARLYRKGSVGSLDETAKFADPEIISVTLESQDIIGLGFNICGNYGDGIRVSEVNNRGPAKESGHIHIGDRILSVQVSYQNIVYEDALTILSYASPYPVKIILEKAIEINSNNFEDEKQRGNVTQRITHPLFRSRSLNTLKHVNHRDTTTHPKRAVSDLKLESVKYFLNWRSKNSKRANSSYENGTSFAKPVPFQSDQSTKEPQCTDVTVEHERHPRSDHSFYENKKLGCIKLGSTLYETVAEVTPVSDKNSDEEMNYQISPPEKPEWTAERDNDYQTYFENQVTTAPTRRPFVYPISSVTDDEIDVDEIVVPDILSYSEGRESNRNISQTAQNTEEIVKPLILEMQTPKKSNSSDDFTSTETLFLTAPADLVVHEPSNHSSAMPAPLLNTHSMYEQNADKLTVAGTPAESTHSLSAEPDEERQNDFLYDFDLNQTDRNSNIKFLSNEAALNNLPDGELTALEHSLLKDRKFTFEDKDRVKPGNPFLEDIAHVVQTEVTPGTDKSSSGASYSTVFPTSVSFLNNKTSSHGSNSSRASQENTDESEISDTLEWSGKRLVRSESFSNIFVDD